MTGTEVPDLQGQDPFVERLGNMVLVRAQRLMLPTYRKDGSVARPALDQNAAIRESMMALPRYIEIAKDQRPAMMDYLEGRSEDFPEGWIADPMLPELDQETQMAREAVREARQKGSGLALVYDYVIDPLYKYSSATAQLPVDLGYGIANMVPGLDLEPPDIQRDLSAMFYSLGSGKSFEQAQEAIGGFREEMEATEDIGGKILGGAGGLAGDIRAIFKGPAKLPLGLAGTAGERLAGKIAEKYLPQALQKAAETAGRGSGMFGALMGTTVRGEDGGAPTWGERLKATGVGMAVGPLIEGVGYLGKRAFEGMLRKGLSSLVPKEKSAFYAMRKWATENRVFPQRNETAEAYTRRAVNAWVENGAPGAKMPWSKLKAHVSRAAVESLGFSSLDERFRDNFSALAWDALQGELNEEALANSLISLGSTALGVGVLHVGLRDLPSWQRNQPTPTGEPPGTPRPQEPKALPESGKPAEAAPQGPTPQLSAPGQSTTPWGTAIRLGWRVESRAEDTSETYEAARPKPGDLKKPKKLPEGYVTEPTHEHKGVTIKLPGTPYWYEVIGGNAYPSQELRRVLGLPGSDVVDRIPVEDFQGLVDKASLISALQSKAVVPGHEITADAIKGAEDGVMRVIRLDRVIQSPLDPQEDWKPAKPFGPRMPDRIDPEQQMMAGVLTQILNQRMDLDPADREVLSSVIDVLKSVSRVRDPSVGEAMMILPNMAQAMGREDAGIAGEAIRVLAEALTIKSPQVLMSEGMQAESQEPSAEVNPESGMLNVGAAAETIKEGVKTVGKGLADVGDFFFRDQIRSIERKSKDRDFAEEMMTAASRGRVAEGEAVATFRQAFSLSKGKMRDLAKIEDVGGIQKARFEALIQGEIEPTEAERPVIDKLNEVLTGLWGKSREAGTVLSQPVGRRWPKDLASAAMKIASKNPGKVITHPSRPGEALYEGTVYFRPGQFERAVVPRTRGSDWGKVMGDPAQRQRWFELLAEKNPGTSAEAFEAQYREIQKKAGPRALSEAEKEAAFENLRQLKNMPYVFEGNQMLEADPIEAFGRIIPRQAGRVATISVFGQENVPEPVLQHFGLDPTKRGVESRLEKFGEDLIARKDLGMTEEARRELQNEARETIQRLQGTEPNPLGRKWAIADSIMRLPKTGLVFKAPLWDVPNAVVMGAQYGGLRTTIKAIGDVLREWEPTEDAARRAGSVVDSILHYAEGDRAVNAWEKFSDWIGKPGELSERVKVVIFDRVVNYVMERFKAGAATGQDRVVLKELGFTPQQVRRLLEGTASKDLRDILRHKMIQAMSGRGKRAERSKFAASRRWMSLIWFAQWATKGLYHKAKAIVNASAVMGNPKSTMQERAGAAKIFAYATAGLAFQGAVGELLYMTISDFMSEGPLGGLKRWYDTWWNYRLVALRNFFSGEGDLLSAVGETSMALGEATGKAALAGPIATLAQATVGKPEDLHRLIGPLAMGEQVLRQTQMYASGKSLGETLYDSLTGVGLIPMGRDLKRAYIKWNAVLNSSDTEYARDKQLYDDFKRLESIPYSGPFPRNKSKDYYRAMREVRNMIRQSDLESPVDEAAIRDKIAEVLKLESVESVAGAIRAMRLINFSELTDDQVDRLIEFMGEERFAHRMAMDKSLTDFARKIGGEMDTEYSTEWDGEVDRAARFALAGVPNAWSDVLDRAVSETAEALVHGDRDYSQLRDLADRMVNHVGSLERESDISENQYAYILKGQSNAVRADRIYKVLREKAKNRRDRLRKEQKGEGK